MSEGEGVPAETAALLSRNCSVAPVILFKRAGWTSEESLFDLVVQTLTPPEEWLEAVNTTVAVGRNRRSRSQLLVSPAAGLPRNGAEIQQDFGMHQESMMEQRGNPSPQGDSRAGRDLPSD
ncbi:MAG TPA: hypothetical protein VGG85_20195 [Terracidiphilus sp.]